MHLSRTGFRTARLSSAAGLAMGVALALLASGASAQMWTAPYDPSLGTLPSAQGFTHYVVDPVPDDMLSESNYTVVGGVLIQGDTGGPNADLGNRQWYEAVVPAHFDFDRDEVVVELRLKILSSTMTPPGMLFAATGFGLTIVDAGDRSVTLYIGETGAFIQGQSVADVSSLYALDTTDGFHDYRFQIDRTGASLEIDGAPGVSLAYDSLAAHAGPGNRFRFGDIHGGQMGSSEIESLVLSGFPPDVTGVRRYDYHSFDGAASSSFGQVDSSLCPIPFQVLGGGVEVIDGDGRVGLSATRRNFDLMGNPGWEGEARELIDTPLDWHLRHHRICGEVFDYRFDSLDLGLFDTTASKTESMDCLTDGNVFSGGVSVLYQNLRLGIRETAPSGAPSEWQAEVRDFGSSPSVEPWEIHPQVFCSSDDGFRYLSNQTVTDSASPKTITVICPPETYPIGGGARINGAVTSETVLRGTHPEEGPNPSLPVGWTAKAEEIVPTATPWNLEVFVSCAQLANPMIAMPGLVGRWKGNGNAADALGISDGTFQNGATTALGIRGEAFSLDSASDQWVEIPGLTLYPKASFSVSVWIETSVIQPDYTEVVNLYDAGGIGVSNASAWGLRLSTEGYPYAFFRDKFGSSLTTVGPAVSAVSVADGLPHHLVFVRDSDTRKARLYVDGEMVHDQTIPIVINAGPLEPGSSPDPVAVGIFRDGGASTLSRPFHGLIDDLELYHRALTDEEVENEAGCDIHLFPRTLNIDATRFGGPSGGPNDLRFCTRLDAGSYTLTLVTPSLDADARFTAWKADSFTDWGTAYQVDAAIDGQSLGGIPLGSSATPEEAFDDTLTKTLNLTLTADQKVWFTLVDPRATDNQGGVSLRVEYLPEPSGPILMATGIVALAAASRSKRARRASDHTRIAGAWQR